jgi:uncharacterized protein (DUF1778 family)
MADTAVKLRIVAPTVDAKSRSGSETRQRAEPITFRANAAERALIADAADRAGLTISSYVRAQSLAKPVTRARRTPPVNRAELARLLGLVNLLGSNVNQIARALNSGRDAEEIGELAATLRAVREMRDAMLLALGMQAGTADNPATVERR